jgi:NADH-quinone oxidoreductase subunit J
VITTLGFYTLATLILAFGVLVITAKDTVHSVIFLIGNFLCIAALYVLLHAEFLAVIQVLVYAGGIVVLYLFVVMLVNLKRPPEDHAAPERLGRIGFVMAAAVLGELTAILGYGFARGGFTALPAPQRPEMVGLGNVEQLGLMLYGDYLVPFEIASMLLLVAMVGAIVLAKREL